jgi:hypothetical protein
MWGRKQNSVAPMEIELYDHGLLKGDHVVRWSHVMLYPVQVHGIVLSALPGVVTIVDFGLAANPKAKDSKNTHTTITAESNGTNDDASSRLEDLVTPEDRGLVDAFKKYQQEIDSSPDENHMHYDRINILALSDEKDIKQWKKVDYGEALTNETSKKWNWWFKSSASSSVSEDDIDKRRLTNNDVTVDANDATSDQEDNNISHSNEKNLNDVGEKCIITSFPTKEESKASTSPLRTSKLSQSATTTITSTTPKNQSKRNIPELPKSDPVNIVLSRVRFLLHNPQYLPPHHIFFSNSECIAVWCKTGRWSTLQASIFLHSTAAGNFKSAATLATIAGTTTVTTTVPASGIAGWFGFTTTTSVGLLTLNPWLIPLLAGYGIVIVGTPLFIYKKARDEWESTTMKMNNAFWSQADADVFVEAIQSWSAL